MWNFHTISASGTGLLFGLLSVYLCNIWQIGRERRSYGLYLFGALTGLLFGLSCALLFVHTALSVLTIFFGFILFMGATIDLKYLILPDEGALLLFISGVVRLWLTDASVVQACIIGLGILVLGSLICKVSRHSIGMGDIKWLAAGSLWLPANLIWLVIYLSFVGGTIFIAGVAAILRFCNCTCGHASEAFSWKGLCNRRLPFGPFLCSAIFLVYLWGEQISAWYFCYF